MSTVATTSARLIRAEDCTGDQVYRVMVAGQQVGIVWRHKNTTAGYWGAWRGIRTSAWTVDDEGVSDFVAARGSVFTENRQDAVAQVLAEAAKR